ncbi:arginine--tRNA ligase [Candidatus Gracilibacteria bacterium]|nr:arginine--tRNA ligase [Candidatus Gracilibacteria bacterium]MCF7856480.1 arginine--tRNA ligase [Candidatus Gracilibacteria bacterium]MCF7896776.1 arginine--tRNA ligase [Candidatus Gracilibacteria bacterium]
MLLSSVSKLVSKSLSQQVDFSLEIPPDKKYGDFACNAAMLLAKELKKNPREVAEEISQKLEKNELVQKIEVAGPGFINIFLAPAAFHAEFFEIEKAGKKFGESKIGKKQKVLLEFISANPTGPLTIANGRGGFGGDVVARVLEKAGFEVAREFYVNDAGRQIILLGESVQLASKNTVYRIQNTEDLYQGEYVQELAKKFPAKISKDAKKTGEVFLQILLENEVKPSIEKMGIKFDKFFSEKILHDQKLIEKNLEKFGSKIYEKDGATFLRTTDCGDDKDRVLKKADGEWTYFAADIAYHADKFSRADKLIDIWGADHHGYLGRIFAAAETLGRRDDLAIIVTQLVKLFREGVEVRMSKRAGNFELMDDLIREVGADVARWFFVMRDWNTHLNFDLDLAKKQSTENPVFYVQYAHTRLASILEKSGDLDYKNGKIELLIDFAEFGLIKKLAELPELIVEIAQNYSINSLTTFATELASTFHKFYEKCRVVDPENPELSAARLRLVATTKEVLRIVLEDLVGVSAPVKM